MNDFDELKQLFDKVSSTKKELKIVADGINKAFLTFEDMNYDCDDEIDEIVGMIDDLRSKFADSSDKTGVQLKIDKLIEKKAMVQEASDLLNKLETQFNDIQSIAEEIDVEV